MQNFIMMCITIPGQLYNDVHNFTEKRQKRLFFEEKRIPLIRHNASLFLTGICDISTLLVQ